MSKSKRNNRRPSLRIRDLERRILLSATWIDTAAVEETSNAGAVEGLESQSIDATLAQIDALLQAEAYVTPPGSDQQLPSSLSEQAENLDAGSSSIDADSENGLEQVDSFAIRHELVLISEEVPDVDQLLAGIRQDSTTLFDVYVVDRSQSGWEQLQNYLVDANIQYDAIHFVTHGTNAGFQFGSDWVNSGTLLNQSETLAQVGQFLSEDADLLLYGCSIAETDAGQNVVTSLAQLTSADVAASSDLTGHWTLGGDWDLEYRVGNVESSFAFSEDLQGNWQYTMVTYTLLDNFASASYSNNNGTNNFAGSWTESDAGGAGAGSGHQLITGGQLRLQPVNAANWIYRDANLSGANSATVAFFYNSTLDNNTNNSSIMFQVSSDGGSNYTTLFTFDKTTNTTSGTLSSDISAYISSNMRFRFDVGTGDAGSYYLYVDDFQVTYGVNTAPTAVSDTATAVEASGVNNGTAGTNPTGNVLTNDTDADAGDTKTVSGVAAGVVGSASTNVGANVSGTYGAINIAANGSYTYTVDNNNAAVQALFNTSNTLTDVFTYTMRDTLGLTSTTQITVTIQGANDAPTDIAGSLSVSENAANGTSVGSLTSSDADAVTTTPTVYVNENFESGATGWTNNTTETASGLTSFLGRFAGSGGNQAVSKTFSLASNLQVAVVEFDLYRIDSWDGESFRVFVNDTQSLSIALNMGSFTQTSGATGNVSWVATPVTSNSNTVFGGWNDQQIRVTLTITQPTASLKVGFGSTLDQDITDEAYGIDNFKITGSGVAYSLVDNAGGRFAVDSLTGAVTVANSSLLNFESATSHNITVRATDFGGQTYDEVMAVTLSDVDEFDVGAVTDSNATTNTVAENAANGTAVGVTASASDADGSNNTITYTLDNNAGGRFSIGSSTGVVTVANSTLLNFESATSHSITVRATSSDGSFSTQSFTINVSDVDEFDVGSVTDTNATADTIAENTANGTAVGITASASDADGSNNTITYSLDDNAGGRFTIASGTGIVTVANSTLLNFESATSHNVTVRATSSDGSFSTQVFTISLTDVDEFDVGSITDTNATANTVVENSANGTAVGITASASDADGSNNTITYSLDDNADGRFAIASGTGIVTVANSSLLNFESATTHNITVRATSSDGSFSTQTYSVAVTNANETPTAVLDTATATEAGGVSNGTAGSNPSGNVLTNDTDPDASDTKTVTGVAAGVVGSASTNVGSNVTGTYGTIQIAANGAYTYTVDNSNATVQALRTSGNTLTDVFTYTMRDTAGLTSTTQITVTIQGANDAPHDLATAGLSVAENSANTTTVGTITRSDVDSGDTATYSLVDNAGGRFAINSASGVITVANSTLLNFEAATTHNVTVRITDTAGATYDEVFTINLTDVDEFDVGSVTDTNATANTVAENAANGTTVGVTASASDADGSNNTITYTLDNNAGGRFAIASGTGIVTVANSTLLNFESATSHSITVRATSSDGSFSTQSFTINLSDVDEFDVGAVTDTNATANTIAENTANGTAVGITASASDADGSNNTITYSLDDNAGGRFTIASGTGIVTVANSTLLNFESATSHNVTVRATSSDGSFSTQVFTISLTDVDEFDVGSVTDTNATANTIAENTANGTAVGITASASDADGSNNTITYSLDDNAGGRFAIASGTGIVTVANSSLLNFESATSHNVTVRATSSDGSFSTQVFTISLTDVDEFDVGSVTDTNATANTIAENTANGTAVGITASASDADGSNNTITYSLDDNAGGRFAIASGTGIVTVANSTLLNFESATSHNVTVRATSSDGSFSTQVFTISLTDVDEFDVGSVTDTNATANTIAENTANGTAVGITASASDADGSNNTITYSLDDNAGGRFTIASGTGIVTVANSTLLNFESATSHNVTVRATSSDGSFSTQVFTISLTDVDEFDVGSVTDTNATANTIAENTANGTAVGITASASDADGSNNTITYSLDDNAGGRFAIASGTGIVTVANSTLLNFESATSHNVTVRATSSDGSFSTQVFTISLTDVDEFDVGSVTDTNATANTIAENTANGTAVGITASASDADGSNNTITYSLDDNAGGRFAISSGTGIVTVANSTLLNFESATSHNITVRATSSDGSFSTQIFTISLTDVDEFDVGSVTDTNATANTIAENTANGTAVGITASASDADGSNNTITYSLDDNAGGRFTIASGTGIVTVANSTLLNFESATSHNITVRATSSDGSFSTQVFTISLTDVDEFDVGSVTDTNATANTIAENTANGTAVGITASASDADGSNNTITYSLDDNAGGRFAIAGGSGIITVANSTLLNFESSTSHNVTVRATSSDGSFSTQTFTISLTDVDEFDVGTVTDTNAAANSIAENTANGTAVGVTAFATDADATNNTITYTLDDNAGGRFTVHASTGVVTVANSTLLNYEAATSHNITVRATSADGSFSTQIFTVNLTDVDEFDVGAITDSNATANTIAENSANGTSVGITATASDADATNNTITYTLDDSASGRFSIHATTGIVTVANSTLLNYEAATSHNITVRATSADGSFSTQVYTVNLTDVDEFDVGSVTDTNATSNNVNENASVGTTVGITASASDADSTNNTITYSLFNSDGGRFAIDSTTGVVTVAGAINREADGASRSITVRATSSDGSYTDQIFSIAINDVDEFDVGSVTDTNATSNNVNENASVGTVVGITAAASDADSTNNTITYSLFDNDGGRFAIDSTTGVVTVAGAINREADGASRSITVRATSSDGSYTDQIFSIAINDVDEFDVGSVTDTNATSNNVNENANVGTVVGITAAASDADSTNNTITYSLFDNDGGRFAIDSTTGIVTVAGAINREVDGSSRSITVRATSSDGSYTDQIFSIAINDIDEFDVGSVTDTNATSNNVNENASVGTVVGITASASDADSTNNSITYSLQNSDGGRFAIDSTTGVVTVAGAINREADGASRSITVRATSSDGSYTDQAFSIAINDVDEFDVGSVTDTNATSNNVNENASVGTVVGITAAASDADSTNNTITYSLFDNDGGRFAIDSTTGVVTVAGAINREVDGASRSITVRATSSDGSYTDQIFSIAINDVDEFDVGSVTDTNATSNNVNENVTVGTVVGITAAASDADSTNNTITYSLFDNDGGRFAIDSTTGVVTVASAINREVDGASRSITVRATSSDGSHTDQVFSIAINDVDEFDVGSVTDTNATSNNVNENASVGTLVGITAAASDADSTNNTITYSLFDNDGGRFAIDSTTGVVTVASAINREADGASRSITVRATSSDGSYTDQIFSIAINDVDEFDVGSVTDTNATSNNVNENASVGTLVGITAAASDADSTNNTITYSLQNSDGGRFAIDSTTGVVTVAGAINREVDGASRSITVRATSSDGSHTDQIFSIAINDVDEFDVGSVTDTNATSNNVNENASVGTLVGITAAASDADSTNNTITYSLFDNDGGRFAIDSTTGVVTVASAINREIDGASRSITVRATSSDGSHTDQIFSIAINDVDEFDVGSVTDTNATSNDVNENASAGTVVGITASASDADSTNNTIIYSLFDNDGGRFAIDSTTGIVTVAGAINREADGASRSITVRATSSDGSYTDQIFSIAINDVDEFDVGSVTDTNATSNNVNENATVGTVVGITAAASDADSTNNTITFSLFDNDGGRFAIDSTTGVVTVASAINREADGASRSITVRATSSDGSHTDQVFSIAINDVDEFDVGSVTDTNATSNNVNENATVGTVVGITAAASDADSTNNTITFSLFDNDGGRFAIDSTTGVVTVASAINREADGASRSITVRATSSDGSHTDQVFSIAINDVDEFDVGSVTDTNATSNNVNENASVGTVVGITASASDADSTNNTITYSLFDNDGGRFAIDSTTGVVTVASAINREADGASRSITVRATSSDGSHTDQIFSIAINDVDEFDVGSVTDTNATSNNVNENASVGTVVGITASASDADSTNNTITYSLFDNDSGRFAIDSTTGVVTVASAINREADGASRSITVRATSSDGSYTDQIFSIAINDVDEFDVGSVTDTNATSNNVNENATVGTEVGITAAASDADSTNNTITYSLFDNDGGRFAIDSTTGVVTVASAINREADGASRSITVRATSSDGSYTDQIFSIAINDVDEFDVGSVTDTNATSNNVNENATVGTVVGITAAASDADSTNNTITYSLFDNDGGRFAIDSNTGVVTVASAIDREADGASRSITIRATSTDGSYTDQVLSIAINDVDEFDVGAVSDTNVSSNNVDENATVGTMVGITASASDVDATNNAITYSLFDDDGGRFAIDGTTGIVTVAGTIDREVDGASRSITVRATSTDGSYTDQVFSIAINDVDEFNVGSVTDTNATSNNVNENASIGTIVGITAAASDLDATNNTITYALFDNDGGRFAIDSNTGVVTVASAIDREADGASRSITIRATSTDGSYTDQVFSIAINDVDEFDVGTVSDTNVSSNNVNENAIVGTVVGITAAASDVDATNNAITYSLFDDDGGRFAIDGTTGIVTVAGTIDREVDGASRSITVRATSADGSYTDQVFSIAINDVDEFDVGSVTDTNATSNNVDENASVGTIVGITAAASDVDATNNTITYSLFDNDGGRFAIDSTTGIVTVAGAIDREVDGASRSITIRATSADGSFTDQAMSIAINDLDEFDVGSVTDADVATNVVNENAAIGTTVGLVAYANDLDATTSTISYSLVNNDGGRFAIDSVTGAVTVANSIDRELDGAVRSIIVRATSADGSFTDQNFSIQINDVDEFDVTSSFDTDSSANEILENTLGNATVGLAVIAQDLDATTNIVTYSLDNDAGGRFSIDSLTGVVTQNGPLDHETTPTLDIIVRATSADGSFSQTSFTIHVLNANEFPFAIDDAYNSGENAQATLDVMSNDYDLDPGDQIQLVAAQLTQGMGSVQVIGNTLVYNPGNAYDYLSVGESVLVVINYQIEDSFGLTDNASVAITIAGQRDQLAVTVGNVQGSEDSPFAWPISVNMVDTNGETLTDVVVRGLPVGTEVTDQFGMTRTVGSTGAVSVFGMDLGSLQYLTPQNFSGLIQATVDVVSSLGNNFIQSFPCTVDIAPVADLGEIFATGGRTDLGSTLALPINYYIEDMDGSEIPTLGISGIPQGMRITDGTNNYVSQNPTQWANLNGWNLTSLRLVTDGGTPGDYNFTYRLTIVEGANGSTSVIQQTIKVVVDEVLPQISNPGQSSPQTIQFVSTTAQETSTAAEPLTAAVTTEETAEMSTTELNPENASTTEVTNYVFETDSDIEREFDSLLRATANDTSVQQTSTLELSLTEQFGDTVDGQQSGNGVRTMEEFEMAVEALQEITETEELLRNQSELEVETQQQFSIQSGLIAFWNLIRANISPQETNTESDARNEIRVTQRTDRRNE